MTRVDVTLVDAAEWRTWRDLRLRALRDSPDAFGSTLERELGFTEDDWTARLDGPGASVLARISGEPVGIGAGWSYEPGKLMVVAMWTDPRWRGQGVGGRVLGVLVDWARQHALRPDLWVADANPAARAVYERYGFVPDGESAPLRDGSPLTMTRLVLPDR